jgi:hypothetical protein
MLDCQHDAAEDRADQELDRAIEYCRRVDLVDPGLTALDCHQLVEVGVHLGREW